MKVSFFYIFETNTEIIKKHINIVYGTGTYFVGPNYSVEVINSQTNPFVL